MIKSHESEFRAVDLQVSYYSDQLNTKTPDDRWRESLSHNFLSCLIIILFYS